jgi:AcrR family transcriptional regulator
MFVSEREQGGEPARRRRKAAAPREPQLPSGRHGLSRSFVVSNQRERIMKALVATICSYGYTGCSVERIAVRAGVSRRTFYEQFTSREDAYLQTFDTAADCLLEHVGAAWEEPVDGRAQLRLCLQALLEAIAGEPELARVCIVDVLSVGPQALEHRERLMRSFAALLEKGALEHNGAPPPPLATDGLAAAIYDVIYKRVAQGQARELPDLLDDLHSFCLMLFQYAPVPSSASHATRG